MARLKKKFQIDVEFLEPIPLIDIEEHRNELKKRGVYILREGVPQTGQFSLSDTKIVYIGKAIGETIYSRCRKHLQSVRAEKTKNGKPKTNPGKRFIAYREEIKRDPSGLFIFPGFMNPIEPYLISCAEEYLLYKYREQNDESPAANTK